MLFFFWKVYSPRMFLSYFHFPWNIRIYLLTSKTPQDVNNSFWFLHGMNELLYAILCMSEATFGVWLWPQLSWCSMYTSRQYFVIKIYKNINHRYFNVLLELPKGMSLIGSFLVPSFSLVVTLEKIVLIKKVHSEHNYKSI